MEELKIGEETTYRWFEEGGAIIKRTEQGYELYLVPEYGGEENYIGVFDSMFKAEFEADILL